MATRMARGQDNHDRQGHGQKIPDAQDRSEAIEPSDLELLRGVGRGHEESFRRLFRRWAPRLHRFLTHTCGSPETGEDLLQEAFLRILQAAPRFEERGTVRAWMYRISVNLAYSHWRRERSSPVPESALSGASCGDLESHASADRGTATPDRMRADRAFVQDVRGALRRLPENQRLVFLLKVDQGLSYEEIAAALRCPVGTAKTRFHHGVRKLRQALRDWDEDRPAHPRDLATTARDDANGF